LFEVKEEGKFSYDEEALDYYDKQIKTIQIDEKFVNARTEK
jgi:hypothetical protein